MARLHHEVSAPTLPLALIAQAVPMLTRHELASVTERLIERLDEVDVEPDREEDDPPGQDTEDELSSINRMRHYGFGPGCPLSGDHEMGLQPAETFGGTHLGGKL